MPVITKTHISLRYEGDMKHFVVTVMYNQTLHFYIALPDQFSERAAHLTEAERKQLFLCERYGGRPTVTNLTKTDYVIIGDTEANVIALTRTALSYLLDKAVTKRNVILVMFIGNQTTQYGDHQSNNEHPPLGLQLSITYCVETSLGTEKIYKMVGRPHAFRPWRTTTAIEDTPENRLAVEQLYQALQNLIEKLKNVVGTTETLQNFISSNIKLLG